MLVQVFFVLVTWNVAQVGQVDGLGVDDGVKVRVCGTNLVVMHGQVRIEFAGHLLKSTVIGCKNIGSFAASGYN